MDQQTHLIHNRRGSKRGPKFKNDLRWGWRTLRGRRFSWEDALISDSGGTFGGGGVGPKPQKPIDFHGLQNFCIKSFGVCLRLFEFVPELVPLLSGVFFAGEKSTNHDRLAF
ncbi:hypothetical protein CEXT_479601 [Caerostris extrusa]|uniref:Uncharacterized protein n=1 Tax=Caerostris extrusa TaxID=172846 RepID=A0AAV4MKP1_CAEEX|nr:hypothetical protein CEXT_479601 [Caerostris extrusa]